MLYVGSDRSRCFYASFDRQELLIVSRTTRVGSSVKMRFDPLSVSFEVSEKSVPIDIRTALLPMYQRFLENTEKREEARKLCTSLSFDLDDSACRDFNSFG